MENNLTFTVNEIVIFCEKIKLKIKFLLIVLTRPPGAFSNYFSLAFPLSPLKIHSTTL